MAEFVKVGSADEVDEGTMVRFEVEGEPVTVARVEGGYYAFGDYCPHARCSLADGWVEGTMLTCPCHGSQFDVASGAVITPPAVDPLETFEVRVENGELQVGR
ncbi:MAG: Rieske (2Fe-2S) protein [Actinomycetota bacterium]